MLGKRSAAPGDPLAELDSALDRSHLLLGAPPPPLEPRDNAKYPDVLEH